MRIAILSDTHLGDPMTKLVRNGQVTDTFKTLSRKIRDFGGGAPVDYLVLNGDILDFSMAAFDESCKVAKPFFQALSKDGVATQIVYIPGNHDKHVWDALDWEVNIVRRMKRHSPPKQFKRTQPAVLDYAKGYIELPNVATGKKPSPNRIFLEGLFLKDKALPIWIVYPNLYIRTADDMYLVTHGHMLEPAWVLLSELFQAEPELAGTLGVAELEEYNIPLASMICTGVGQAGAVSKLFHTIAQEAKRGKAARLKRLMDHVVPNLDKLIELPWYAELLDNVLLKALRRMALSTAESVEDTRYNEKYFEKKSVRKRFARFYVATCAQAEELGLPPPGKIVFGHTHRPMSANEPMETDKLDKLGGKALLYNTGGWLADPGKRAELFFLNDAGALSSTAIE